MAIEIVDLPIKNSVFHSYVNVYQRVCMGALVHHPLSTASATARDTRTRVRQHQ